MKGLTISIVLAILLVVTVLFLMSIIKNKRLSIDKKVLWAAIVIFFPIIGGIVYFTRKGEANA